MLVRRFLLIVNLLFFFAINSLSYAKDIIIYPWYEQGGFAEDYFLKLLKLSLENSKDEFGDYELEQSVQTMYQGRAIVEIKRNRSIDVMWTMTSIKRERQVTPIRIPLLKGLAAYRIFLIKEGAQERFAKITSEQQLKDLIAGQGKDWPDSYILLDNNYGLMTAAGHNLLFSMLQHGRFDYMPRALHEPWQEIKKFPGLQVESSLAIHYPAPFYFFVSNDNPKLKKRIEVGLTKAEQNGSFQHLFDTHPMTQNMVSSAKLKQRKIFRLKNRLLSEETKKIVEKIELFDSKNKEK